MILCCDLITDRALSSCRSMCTVTECWLTFFHCSFHFGCFWWRGCRGERRLVAVQKVSLANLVSQLIVFLVFFAPEQINWAVRTAPTQAFSTSTDSLFLYIWLVFFHIRYCIFSASNYTVSFRLWLWLKSDSYQDLSATAFMYCESHAFCWLPLYMQAAGMCFTPVIWVAQSYTLDPLVILIKSCTNRHQE